MGDTNKKTEKKLLVMLIDGFRWDYFDIPGLELPGFKQLFRQGVKADYMIPDFPSLSFPNYQSIMTGLHVEDHDFVGNFIFHEERNESFEINMKTKESNNSHWFEGGDPLWIAAVKQDRRTHMFEWPGCHISNKDTKSTYHEIMDEWPSIDKMMLNVNKALDLLKANKIDMAGVYTDSIDEWGHSYGPNTKEIREKVKEMDDAIKHMLDLLVQKDLQDTVNIVIFSDHGMTEISSSRTVDISDHIGTPDVKEVMDKGAVCSIWPRKDKLEKVHKGLKGMQKEHISVYKLEELPDRWHYKNSRLVAPITVVADLGWYILTPNGQAISKYRDGAARGHHGFDNKEIDMRGIFIASGPDFKKNFKLGPVTAVDIYQVMCKALDIEPHHHRGTWSSVKDIFI